MIKKDRDIKITAIKLPPKEEPIKNIPPPPPPHQSRCC
jgi:protein TonB